MAALFAQTFKAVAPKEITLCLNDICRAEPLPHGIYPLQRGRQGWNGMTFCHADRNHPAQGRNPFFQTLCKKR